jgi:hypothetical protein
MNMSVRPIAVLGSLLLAAFTSAPAWADESHAPPMLTPSAAADITLACPEAQNAADALVNGITLAQANAALPVLTRCATEPRFAALRWKNMYAAVGVAAVQLSQAILTNDSALFKHVAELTGGARAVSPASDAAIRSWIDIPDAFDPVKHVASAYSDRCGGHLVSNVAYLNVVARSGSAWIATPRTVPATCLAYVPYLPYGAVGSAGSGLLIFARPATAPDEVQPGPGIGRFTSNL